MSVRACLRSLVGRWILLLKKVKFVSRTRLISWLQTTSRYNFLSKITRSDSEWLAVSGELEYMSVRACLRSLVGRWIWLLKKVKFVSRTLFSSKLHNTSRYNFLSKITRSDSEWLAVSGEIEYMSVRACLRSLVGRWIWLLKKVKFVSRTRLSS